MAERPILFNGAMVRAILDGRKTQTRRVVKGTTEFADMASELQEHRELAGWQEHIPGHLVPPCPFGQPGDRLWVRETHSIYQAHGQHRSDGERWGPWGGLPTTVSHDGRQIAYYREGFDRCDHGRWRPSIHMPRWACRIVLEITDVRVERLNAISDQDCMAEGIEERNGHFSHIGGMYQCRTPVGAFAQLWDSAGSDWDSNPWVWVIEFKRGEATHG